jgi:predicted site-specific integrase-resolvase
MQLASLTVPQIAERFAVDRDCVTAWIKSGQLQAIDVSRHKARLPRWRVTPEALQEFEAARSSVQPKQVRTRQKKKNPAGFVEYF